MIHILERNLILELAMGLRSSDVNIYNDSVDDTTSYVHSIVGDERDFLIFVSHQFDHIDPQRNKPDQSSKLVAVLVDFFGIFVTETVTE